MSARPAPFDVVTTEPPRMDFMADIVNGRTPLPTIPRVVQTLIKDLRRGNAGVNALAAELAQDPVLSARVLRLANSSFYCGRRSLASIFDAVNVIGTNALQTLVIACGVSSAFIEVPGVNLRQFWLDAVVTGSAAQLIAQQLGADADSAHSAGLLLGTGHLILCQAHPVAAAAEFTRYRNLGGAALAEREQAVFGVAHPAVGALWVDRLGFPQEVVQAIAGSLDDTPGTVLTAIVRIARQIGGSVTAGDDVATAVDKLDRGLRERLALDDYLHAAAFSDRYAQMRDLPSPT